LSRFDEGGGLLWDLEFLVDDSARRVAAFGRPAGIVGMALGLLQWARQHLHPLHPLQKLTSWKSTKDLVNSVSAMVKQATAKTGIKPHPLIVGALGRCGKGASWFAAQCDIKVAEWDLPETKGGGPFPQLLKHEIVVNAIYLSEKIPPFLTLDLIRSSDRRLSVFVDVSCDFTNPNNPFPIYNQGTTLDEPVLSVLKADETNHSLPLDVIAIDHLPALIPVESSQAFSADLLPHLALLQQENGHKAPVWQRAEQLFSQKVAAAKA